MLTVSVISRPVLSESEHCCVQRVVEHYGPASSRQEPEREKKV